MILIPALTVVLSTMLVYPLVAAAALDRS